MQAQLPAPPTENDDDDDFTLDDFVRDVHQDIASMTQWCTNEIMIQQQEEHLQYLIAAAEDHVVIDAYTNELRAIHDNRIHSSLNGKIAKGKCLFKIHFRVHGFYLLM